MGSLALSTRYIMLAVQLDSIFNLAKGITLAQILACTAVSLALELIIWLAYMWRAIVSKNLAITIIL